MVQVVLVVLLQAGAVVPGPGSPHKPQQQPAPQLAACWALGCQPSWPWQHRQQQTEQASRQQQHLQTQEAHRALLQVLLVLGGRQRLAQAQARSRQPHTQLVVVVVVPGLAAVALPVAVAVVVATRQRALVCWAWLLTRCDLSWRAGQQGKQAAAAQQKGAAGQQPVRAVNGVG
jgi:hypothetical protein